MNNSETNLTQAEIVKYWGSQEAYQEEQRRLGLATIESASVAAQTRDTRPLSATESSISDDPTQPSIPIRAKYRLGLRFLGQKI